MAAHCLAKKLNFLAFALKKYSFLEANKTEYPSVQAFGLGYKKIKAKFLKTLKNFKKTKEC